MVGTHCGRTHPDRSPPRHAPRKQSRPNGNVADNVQGVSVSRSHAPHQGVPCPHVNVLTNSPPPPPCNRT
eukprot:2773466-Amphidinium_carterae.1